jgi:MoxR-like ATPase
MQQVSSAVLDRLIELRREERIGNPLPQDTAELRDLLLSRYPTLEGLVADNGILPLVEKSLTIERYRTEREQQLILEVDRLSDSISDLEHKIRELGANAHQSKRPLTQKEMTLREDLLDEWEMRTRQLETLVQSDPDAFFAKHARTLRGYYHDLENGKLVCTPYVEEKLNLTLSFLQRSYYILLHGDTGSGKTELAKLAGRIFSKQCHPEWSEPSQHEPLLLRCYKGMGAEELFGHFALKSSQTHSLAMLPDMIQEAISEWIKLHPAATEQERECASKAITEGVIHKNGFTVSEYILGTVYRAARDGRVVILDEINFAPPDMLVKLNEFLNLTPGDWVTIQEDSLPPFQMQRGFGMVCTGNVDYSSNKRYGSGRVEFEPSRLNRLSLIDYDYLPQAIKGEIYEVSKAENKQLFSIAISSLLGEESIAVLPEDGIQMLWRLCKYARMTQIAFSGQLGRDDENAFQSSGAAIEHRPEVLISPRNLVRIVKDWSLDAFRYELDHYLYQHFICSTLKPADGALLYQLAKKFGFFKQGWSEGIVSLEQMSALPFRVIDPLLRGPKLTYFHREELIQAIFGAAPERLQIEGMLAGGDAATTQQRLERAELIIDFEELVQEVDELTKQYQSLFPSH